MAKISPLSPDATVTGGSFSLATVLNGSAVTVGGGVSGGSVTRTNPGSTGCVDQDYAVHLDLANVGAPTHVRGCGSWSQGGVKRPGTVAPETTEWPRQRGRYQIIRIGIIRLPKRQGC